MYTPWVYDLARRAPPAGRCSPPCPVRDKVWAEGQNGAGLYLAFKTDAPSVYLNATTLAGPPRATDDGN